MDKLNAFFEKLNTKKAYAVVTAVLFPVLIVLFSFLHVNSGIDITDSTFNYYNCENFTSLNDMWYSSWFLSYAAGKALTLLPFGNTLLFMNIYTGLIKCAIALWAYFFCVKGLKFGKELTFLAQILALGLCWCPPAVLYNYLTYLLFFAAAYFLYTGIVKDKSIRLVIAGVMLGLNVFVRFPNICEVALILVVWAYAVMKKEKPGVWLKKTLLCIAGFVAGLVPGAVAVFVTRGAGSYFSGIKGLFSMTGEAVSYSPFEMVLSVVRAYLAGWYYTEFLILSLLLVLLISLVFPHKLEWLRYILATIVTGGMLFVQYRRGMFNFNYSEYGSIYNLSVVVLSAMYVLFLFNLCRFKATPEARLLSLTALIILAITPLGTNNGLFASINNLFLVAPIFLYFLFKAEWINRYFRPIYYALFLVFVLYLVQSTMFRINFTFRDGFGERMDTEVSLPVAKGMKTIPANAEVLEELYRLKNEKTADFESVLLYGDVSGLAYLMDSDCAIATAWPSLDSHSSDLFAEEISALDASGSKPAVLIGRSDADAINTGTDLNAKQKILKEFLDKNNYDLQYDNYRFCVMLAKRNGD